MQNCLQKIVCATFMSSLLIHALYGMERSWIIVDGENQTQEEKKSDFTSVSQAHTDQIEQSSAIDQTPHEPEPSDSTTLQEALQGKQQSYCSMVSNACSSIKNTVYAHKPLQATLIIGTGAAAVGVAYWYTHLKK